MLRQKDQVSLGYIVRPCLKKQKQNKQPKNAPTNQPNENKRKGNEWQGR
jgi:hypothetical protein